MASSSMDSAKKPSSNLKSFWIKPKPEFPTFPLAKHLPELRRGAGTATVNAVSLRSPPFNQIVVGKGFAGVFSLSRVSPFQVFSSFAGDFNRAVYLFNDRFKVAA